MAYKAMRRRMMEPAHDAHLRKQAGRVYSAIGLPLPEERSAEHVMKERTHGGLTIVTTFYPTEPGPKLNVVHGPLALRDPLLQQSAPVVGLPIMGAGISARLRSDHPAEPSGPVHDTNMEVVDPVAAAAAAASDSIFDKPYFYPRRSKNGGVTKKQSAGRSAKCKNRHPKNNPGIPFI
jgi:hypothetical protein